MTTNGEQVLASAHPAPAMWAMPYLFTLGAAELWRRRNVIEVTDRRVVMRKGIVMRNERSLPREKVQDVNVSSQIGFGQLTITSAGGAAGAIKTAWLRGAEARRIADLLNA